MHCNLLAIGQKMPLWCNLACEDYLHRLQHFIKCSLTEIPAAKRNKAGNPELYKEEEGRRILQKIAPEDNVIALDIPGKPWSTVALAKAFSGWQQSGRNITFIIGGPDGLSAACLARANWHWSLSALTFPHAIVRILLLEQLYRASSLLLNHPYHRE